VNSDFKSDVKPHRQLVYPDSIVIEGITGGGSGTSETEVIESETAAFPFLVKSRWSIRPPLIQQTVSTQVYIPYYPKKRILVSLVTKAYSASGSSKSYYGSFADIGVQLYCGANKVDTPAWCGSWAAGGDYQGNGLNTQSAFSTGLWYYPFTRQSWESPVGTPAESSVSTTITGVGLKCRAYLGSLSWSGNIILRFV
jgi:hypothetical protein